MNLPTLYIVVSVVQKEVLIQKFLSLMHVQNHLVFINLASKCHNDYLTYFGVISPAHYG